MDKKDNVIPLKIGRTIEDHRSKAVRDLSLKHQQEVMQLHDKQCAELDGLVASFDISDDA